MSYVKLTVTHKSILGTMLSAGGLGLLLLFTRPSEDNLALSFAPLLFLWALVYSLIGFVMAATFRGVRHVLVRVVRIAIASSSTLLVMFRALGSVSLLDITIILLLAIVGSFYFNRTLRKS